MKPPDQVSGPDAQLAQRLAQSVAVVYGVVSETSRATGAGPRFLSQHDPDWWQATVDVKIVENGEQTTGKITVMFANSSDIAWVRSPKLKTGSEGVFLLQTKDPFGNALPGRAVVDPLDFQPASELPHVRDLLKRSKPKP